MSAPWRLAKSLIQLRSELNAAFPKRSKRSDGALGDASHQSRRSDHNPWVPPPAGGVVTAIDITHDPDGGIDCAWLAAHLIGRAAAGDKRLKYVIWNRRIASATHGWDWRAYSGPNPHDHHLHVSVAPILSLADSAASWEIRESPARSNADKVEDHWGAFYAGRPGSRTVRRWSAGKDVAVLQRFIGGGIADDGYFGAGTEAAVKEYQRMRGLTTNGVVGPRAWAPILKALGL